MPKGQFASTVQLITPLELLEEDDELPPLDELEEEEPPEEELEDGIGVQVPSFRSLLLELKHLGTGIF
ncbi:MAG: hypothetical protein A3F80_02450 [Candidatus Melainabacteria bacterium RIFCSPLOWO2_12_FULL_35_11]|nr:MAG: hypothetical protein A3F80_02450 [Candidatus Melainabacteria bacterium RIFCSPLOWO2_12_FULL_35_11]